MPKLSALTIGFRELCLVVAAMSVLSLASALAFEHLGGIRPCPLCLEERIAYYAAVPLALLAFLLARLAPLAGRLLLGVIALAFVFNAGLGAYHSGVEWHWWAGPDECSGVGPIATSTQDLLKNLTKVSAVVRCDEAPLRIFGISLAGYSALLSAFLAALAGAGAAGFEFAAQRFARVMA